ncbi:carbon storage regulator CsrA [Providencia stuartii]|uniref:carbon storage regulator CsrA n=1 Tax=Providencia stuartii TaxID=588 RepID=UPI001873E6A8|nr:carbon storage regulator CsrA [Providencia thailandensis]GHB81788.1 carbon storage regulator [Providencia thailandensis]
MLVLARKKGETVMIGDEIEVKVLRIFGDQVTLGISAPKDTQVYREEIYKRIQEEKGVTRN